MNRRRRPKRKPYLLIAASILLAAIAGLVIALQNRQPTTPGPARNFTPKNNLVWQATRMPLGDTSFVAAAGPRHYDDSPQGQWKDYRIAVEVTIGLSTVTCFERDLPLNEIPSDDITRTVPEIVTYNATARVVKFRVGHTFHTFLLPTRTSPAE